jgi:hypothetical protein
MPARPAGSEAGSEVAPGVAWPASERRRDLSGWFYVGPSLLINCLFLLFPVFATLWMSLTSWNGLESPQWVGAANFLELFASQPFWGAAVNNAKWTVIFLTVPIALALLVAAASPTARLSPDPFSCALHIADRRPGPCLAGNDLKPRNRPVRLARQTWDQYPRSSD